MDSGACPGPRSGIRRNDQEVQVHVIPAKAGIQTTRRSTVLPDLLRSYIKEPPGKNVDGDPVLQEGYSLRRALAMERKGEFLYFSMNSLRVSLAFSGWLERP